MNITINEIMEMVCLALSAYLAYRGEMASASYVATMAVYFTIKNAMDEE